MNDQQVKPPTGVKKSRPRSPAYPAIDLARAVERVRQLYAMERTHATPLAAAFRHWGYESTAGDGNLVASALKKFGLVEYEGAGTSRRLKVTSLAVKILEHPDEDQRQAALKAAALLPAIHKELWAKHRTDGLPSDASLRWELEQERGFTPTGAAEFIPEYKATLSAAGLVAGGTVEPQADGEDEPHDDGDPEPDPKDKPVVAVRTPPRRKADGVVTYQVPLQPGKDIVVEFPYPPSSDDFDFFVTMLQAVKPRLVVQDTEPEVGG